MYYYSMFCIFICSLFYICTPKSYGDVINVKLNNKTNESGFVFAKAVTRDIFTGSQKTSLKTKKKWNKKVRKTYAKIEQNGSVSVQFDIPKNTEYAIQSFVYPTKQTALSPSEASGISLKKSSWGKPVYPYGFSGNVKHMFGPPTFDEIGFVVKKDGEYIFLKESKHTTATMEINLT